MAEKISVLLVDDHALVRRGFRRMLEDEEDIIVKGEASDGEEAVRLAKELQPQVIVMDCALPGAPTDWWRRERFSSITPGLRC